MKKLILVALVLGSLNVMARVGGANVVNLNANVADSFVGSNARVGSQFRNVVGLRQDNTLIQNGQIFSFRSEMVGANRVYILNSISNVVSQRGANISQ